MRVIKGYLRVGDVVEIGRGYRCAWPPRCADIMPVALDQRAMWPVPETDEAARRSRATSQVTSRPVS